MNIFNNNNNNIQKLFDKRKENIEKYINELTLSEIEKSEKDFFVNEIENKFKFYNMISFDFDKIRLNKEMKTEQDIKEDDFICCYFTLPYSGNKEFLEYRPVSTFHNSNFKNDIEVMDGYILKKNKYSLKDSDIKRKIDEDKKNILSFIKYNLNYLNNDIEKFNKDLNNFIKDKLDLFYNNLKEKVKLYENIELDLIENEDAPNLEPIELKLEKVDEMFNNDNKSQQKKQYLYIIKDKDYININKIIDLSSKMMERCAYLLDKLDEEGIRSILLVALNTHYKNVTGETFNKRGKTDIFIQVDDYFAFIAECKIWGGKGTINEAINQLLSYCTWRNGKVSLIFYNKKNKNFEKILEDMNDFLNSYQKIVNFDRVEDNIWRCKVKNGDFCTLTLNISIYDLFSKEDIKSD